MAMYLDAIDWVSLPNALGMSQYGDGGIVGTKPYAASGNYIHKMSNYCRGCPYDLSGGNRRGRLPLHHALLRLCSPATMQSFATIRG